jgi:hypothetical protein
MKDIDLYGNPFNIHVSGNYSIKSSFGVILTLITYSLLFASLIENLTKVIYKSEPFTYQEKLVLEDALNLNFTGGDGRIFFNLFYADNKSVFYDPTLIKIEFVSKVRKIGDPILSKKIHKIEACNNNSFNNLEKEYLSEKIKNRLMEKKYYCPDFNNLTLSGSLID